MAAVALGARWIEKHFTDRKTDRAFHDHALSSEPHEMAQMVRDIREIESALGTGAKGRTTCEESGLLRLRRGLAVRHDMKAGAKVTAQDITWLRPQTAFPLGTADRVVGHTLKRDLPAGHQVNPEDID